MKRKRLLSIALAAAFLLSLLTAAVLTINIAAQEETWVEIVSERTRTGKKFQGQLDPNRFALDLSIGAIHYDSPNWKEINNTLVPSTANVPQLGLADWEMTQDDYEWFALETLNTVPMWLYRNRSVPDSYITFNPQSLQWTNDLDQINQISLPSAENASIGDNSLSWTDAYGSGRNLTLLMAPNRMIKRLTLDSHPGNPPSFITDGENASLEMRFILDTPSGPNQPDIFVNGELWERRERVQTAREIEFRLGNETLFVFVEPTYSDSNYSSGVGNMILTRQGGNIIVGVRVPLAFLQTAVYPVTIDPTVDVQVGAGPDDVRSRDDGNFSHNTQYQLIGHWSNIDVQSAFRVDNVGVPKDATITAANINVTAKEDSGGTNVFSNVFLEAADDPVTPTSESDHNGRTRTTNFAAWDQLSMTMDTLYNSPDMASTVEEVTDRSGWVSGQAMLVLWDDDGTTGSMERYSVHSYNSDTSLALVLHIEYTTDGVTCQALTVVVNNPSGQLFFNGTTDDPTGGLWQEENVSEDFQTAVTPAINVTNDDTAGACDLTLELLTSPGSGRTMKFSTTSTPPNPGVNSVPVGSNVTVANVAAEATQTVWLWIDLDDSQGGQATPTLRVDTEIP